MARTPIVSQVSWLNAGINIAILFIFVLLGFAIDPMYGPVIGAAIYFLFSQGLRRIIARHHRQGILRCKRHEFEAAILDFQQSIEFFERHPWLDNYRAITMLSASGLCYREMGLVSLGFSYGQMGDGDNARKYY